jgi:hypothetical protein
MNGVLEQFEIAARELDRLIAEAPRPADVTPLWLEHAQAAVTKAGTLINNPDVPLDRFNFCAEVKHYRSALLKLKPLLEKGQAYLATQNVDLQGEHMRIKRVQQWAETVEVLT